MPIIIDKTVPATPVADLDATLEVIEPLGLRFLQQTAPTVGDDTMAWTDHLNFVSDAIEQRPAILVIPFTDIDDATAFIGKHQLKRVIVSLLLVIMVLLVKKLKLLVRWLLL